MAVRLGTQNWINPGPFQAAAEMVADVGRVKGAGIAAIGAGIAGGFSERRAVQEREQRRSDVLAQQGIENARATRAEDRAVAEAKLSHLSNSLTAAKMELNPRKKS
jgi:hypothetical protein